MKVVLDQIAMIHLLSDVYALILKVIATNDLHIFSEQKEEKEERKRR